MPSAHLCFDQDAPALGDARTGHSRYENDVYIAHDMNIGGEHVIMVSDRTVPAGTRRLGVRVRC
jgi:hypothetical protein